MTSITANSLQTRRHLCPFDMYTFMHINKFIYIYIFKDIIWRQCSASRTKPPHNVTLHGKDIAVCCSVLQRVAVRCSVLQCVAARNTVMLWCYTARMLQCVAVCCSVLQCVAVCCSVCCSTKPPQFNVINTIFTCISWASRWLYRLKYMIDIDDWNRQLKQRHADMCYIT